MNSKNSSIETRLELADLDIIRLEKKLLPATILGGIAAVSLIPLGALIGELLGQKEYGAVIGTLTAISSGVYWTKNISKIFYEPIYKKYDITSKQWEEFYLNKFRKGNPFTSL